MLSKTCCSIKPLSTNMVKPLDLFMNIHPLLPFYPYMWKIITLNSSLEISFRRGGQFLLTNVRLSCNISFFKKQKTAIITGLSFVVDVRLIPFYYWIQLLMIHPQNILCKQQDQQS